MEEEEVSKPEEKTDDQEVIELQGMWDFILPNEEAQEARPVATKSRSPIDFTQTNQKKKVSTSAPKDKEICKKSLSKSTQTAPPQTDSSPSAKTLLMSDEMEYNM